MFTALNISSRDIRVLTVKGRQVKKWSSIPLDAGLVRDGQILQPQPVAEAINALLTQIKAPKEKIITSVTDLSFTYRFLNLPVLKPALQEEAVLRAARKEISLPLDELYLSWQAIGISGDEQEFLILGIPRNLIDSLTETLAIADIEPCILDLKALALARAAGKPEAIIANLEPDCFDIVLVAKGIPVVMHTISPRGEGSTLEDNIQRLTDEISRTLTFYQSNHPENSLSPATPLLLSGTIAEEPATPGMIQAETEYPVESLVPPLQFPTDFPVAQYVANMGLVLKRIPQNKKTESDGSRFHDININLFSGKYRKAKTRPLKPRYLVSIILLIIAWGFLLQIFLAENALRTVNNNLQEQLNIVNRNLNLASLVSEEADRKQELIREITLDREAIERQIQAVLGRRSEINNNLILVTETLPADAIFTSIEITRNTIIIQGITESPFTAVSYAENLEGEKIYQEVRITELDETASVAIGETTDKETPVSVNVITFEVLIKRSAPDENEEQFTPGSS